MGMRAIFDHFLANYVQFWIEPTPFDSERTRQEIFLNFLSLGFSVKWRQDSVHFSILILNHPHMTWGKTSTLRSNGRKTVYREVTWPVLG